MGSNRIIKSDFNGLNNLVKALSNNKVVRVGILGKKNSRKDDEYISNAELGAVHEFGSFSKHIPARSFLRMPIHKDAERIAKDAGKGANEMVEKGNMIGVLKRIGIACEAAIQRAFASAGFGEWAPDKPSTIRRKGSASPLIDTAQLRRSISSDVVAKA